MSKAVVVGERHHILGFKGVGFEIVAVDDKDNLERELVLLAKDPEVGLVLVLEGLAAQAPKALEEFRQRSSAILAVIPTHEGSKGISYLEMRRSVERSLGVDILGKE